ncbi:hypothetical protein D039_3505B, partial [Vibrio parahaemolyticus EKP-028]
KNSHRPRNAIPNGPNLFE